MKPPAPEPPLVRVAVWYALLALVGAHGLGGLADLATSFVLKDRLGLGPEAMARYAAILALPAYAAFLFGHARDRWVARVGGDRNLAALGAGDVVLAYAFLASAEPTYGRLLAATLGATVASSFLGAALNGAIVRFTAGRGVTDRWSAFSLALGTGIAAVVAVTSGWAAAHVPYRPLLGLTAGLGLAYVGLLFLAPRGAFLPAAPEEGRAAGRSLVAGLVELARSPAFLAALGLSLAYNFGPASGSAFFYFMTDRLKAGPEILGRYNAAFNLATLPVALLYGALARRTGLRSRMALAMVLIFLQPLLFFLFRTPADLLPVGALFGASNAIFLAASVDQLLLAIPRGAEGMGFAVYNTVGLVVVQVSNLIGAHVYAAHGLAPCVWLTFPVAALGFPLLALVPREPRTAA